MEPAEHNLAHLSPVHRRLLELMLRQQQASASAPPQSNLIPRRSTATPAPLSFVQQRLWFIHQLEPDTYAYNLRTAVRLSGRLDAALLKRTLDAIVQRH